MVYNIWTRNKALLNEDSDEMLDQEVLIIDLISEVLFLKLRCCTGVKIFYLF